MKPFKNFPNNPLIWVLSFFVLAAGCTQPSNETDTSNTEVEQPQKKELTKAEQIVNQVIETAGGEKYLNSSISFDFRKMNYKSERNGGKFTYYREFKDSIHTVHDVLSNDGYSREIDGQQVQVIDSMISKYSASVNSVIYFALLPYGLNDAAVNKKYLGETTIKGQPYHEIEVTFNQNGGGQDFDDVFTYWIHKDNNTIDYLAYLYHTDEGGLRFREAYNVRNVNGVRFVDYVNYKPKDESIPVNDLDEVFSNGELIELSRIELENIQVELP
ncbi:MAG: DUF6503 family protein [Bacteroidota bacterium]